jgi:hypothetical protein
MFSTLRTMRKGQIVASGHHSQKHSFGATMWWLANSSALNYLAE